MFSSMIHQFAFTAFSSLPYAVGQVQDAGLIFLSAMTSSIALELMNDPQSIISTCLFTTAIATLLLGIVLVELGRLKLASIVQYMPMPVIGGYLAYIGFFCAEGGVSMMAGINTANSSEWSQLLNLQKIYLVFPGLISGICMYVLLPRLPSPIFLPALLTVLVMAFYFALAVTGSDLQSSRDYGWVAPLTPSGFCYLF
jgi:SulP family sulfate permease